MNNFYEEDKWMVLDWMEKHCLGVKNAKTRDKILPFINIEDRRFRAICHDLIHEGHLCSHNSRGYWFRPLWTNDPEEIGAIKQSIFERKSKALSMIEDCEKQLREIEHMRQGQQVMELAI